ncbi:MAG: mannose-phosphate guanylyltransferase / mannose-6-phosphate isomerase, partial [Candidatus Diapherotrites archaeon]|nr:mannose-phosphate guanylyltransferase / mannose-6-phosphate isomerase [Candidatus Diapherotrites archaeon]
MLKEIEKYAPEVYLTFKKYNCDAERIYPIIEPISLSSQVLEKSKKNAVIPVALTWSDMGSYDLMHKLSDKDENGNVANTNFISLDAHGNFVETYNGKTVAMIGVDDLFVIDTPDALIIGPHSRSQDVKTIFKMLEQRKHPVTDYHTRIEMRWGHVQIVESTEDYTIAKIFLRPGARAKIQIEYPATVSVVKGSVAVASGKDRKILETGNAVSTSNEIIELENLERDPAEIVMTVIANLKTNPYVEILKELEG